MVNRILDKGLGGVTMSLSKAKRSGGERSLNLRRAACLERRGKKSGTKERVRGHLANLEHPKLGRLYLNRHGRDACLRGA